MPFLVRKSETDLGGVEESADDGLLFREYSEEEDDNGRFRLIRGGDSSLLDSSSLEDVNITSSFDR